MKDCKHETYYWTLATNENGWACSNCGWKPGEPEGFSPQIDRSHISSKVECILLDMHAQNFVRVGYGSEGEWLANDVAARCKRIGLYDQYTIVREIMFSLGNSHAKYWKDVSNGIIAGNDPRNRCQCGKLATFCSEHRTSYD